MRIIRRPAKKHLFKSDRSAIGQIRTSIQLSSLLPASKDITNDAYIYMKKYALFYRHEIVWFSEESGEI